MSDEDKQGQDGVSSGDFVELVYNHQNRYIELADRKASLLLTAHIAYLGLFINIASGFWAGASFLLKGSTVLTLAAIILVIGFASKAVYPNTPETPQGLILWESITDKPMEKYRSTLLEKNDPELLEELTDEAYKLAEVADNKYPSVRQAMWSTGAVIVLSMVTAYLAYGSQL